MARHRRRHHRRRHHRGARGGRILGMTQTQLLLLGAGLYFTGIGQQLLGSFGFGTPAPTSTAGLYGTRTIAPGLGAWGRPTLPVVGMGAAFFRGFRGGLGAFHTGSSYPARRWWT